MHVGLDFRAEGTHANILVGLEDGPGGLLQVRLLLLVYLTGAGAVHFPSVVRAGGVKGAFVIDGAVKNEDDLFEPMCVDQKRRLLAKLFTAKIRERAGRHRARTTRRIEAIVVRDTQMIREELVQTLLIASIRTGDDHDMGTALLPAVGADIRGGSVGCGAGSVLYHTYILPQNERSLGKCATIADTDLRLKQ